MNLSVDLTKEPHLVASKDEIRINCPHCEDTKFHCYINRDKWVFNCFKCGASGKLASIYTPNLLQWDSRIFYKSKQVQFAPMVSLSDPILAPRKLRPHTLPISEEILPNRKGNAWIYLHSRGITDEQLEKYKVRTSHELHGPYKNSIIFPIYQENKLVYFVCRKYTGDMPKYINAPWPKGDTLFIAYPPQTKRVVIVEGIFDALAVENVGCIGIALLGKKPTSGQLIRLRSFAKNVIIYLDHDAFSHAINLKLQLLAMGIGSSIVSHNLDASALYCKEPKELESLLEHT